MDPIDFTTHDKFINFPPLYTEQINNATLSKQLDIWHKIINDDVTNDFKLYTLGTYSVDAPPFKNLHIHRNLNVAFLALILEYLVEKKYAFYLHPIHMYCENNNVTIWGALFANKKSVGSNLLQLHEEYGRTLDNGPRKSPRNQDEVDVLKNRRDVLMKSNYKFGLFPYPLADMVDAVLSCIKSQCSNREIETVYYIFYNKRECNKDFNGFPEDHLAFLLSYLCSCNKISLSFNEGIPPSSLNNKNVGIQLV
ncbi:hypothetical protein MACJ_002019 [Theileria orientalis]|uniref:ESCRT-II complex subunit VPS25 n=1 Tax=Theileria orientalis TaxID=68886 RepID=A0A976QSC0_THEOR|nr:hypothetical protein MACJ_002019 [Theileria orientalis]